eukprot:2283317-Prymnesium_polylepis.1
MVGCVIQFLCNVRCETVGGGGLVGGWVVATDFVWAGVAPCRSRSSAAGGRGRGYVVGGESVGGEWRFGGGGVRPWHLAEEVAQQVDEKDVQAALGGALAEELAA